MKNCIRIPRVFLPRSGGEEWVAPPCDCSKEEWKAAERGGDGLSALSCLVPDFLRSEDDAELFEKTRENAYAALENGDVERIERGFLLVRRKTDHGERKGILGGVDLEELSLEGGGTIRLTTDTVPALVRSRARERACVPLEFPHTVLAYRDRRDKLMRALEEEELELLYDFSADVCTISGYFIPEFLAEEVAHDLMRYADPCFGVLDGNHSLAAAKAHWEEIKKKISAQEAKNHPARFTLVEFVNLCDGAVVPVDADSGAPVKKEELLSLWKSDRTLPVKSLRLKDARCSLEGREISYD